MICPYCKSHLKIAELKAGQKLPQCDAVVPARWYAKEHRCPMKACGRFRGKNLCGTHIRYKNLKRPLVPPVIHD